MNRRSVLMIGTVGLLAHSLGALAASAATLKMIKNPDCGCCIAHAEYLHGHGYVVEVQESAELDQIRSNLGVPADLTGCHLVLADDYVIEGHVPAAAIDKLLSQRPMIKGIAVPGMPEGSPGMTGEKTGPLVVYEITDGTPKVFFTE